MKTSLFLIFITICFIQCDNYVNRVIKKPNKRTLFFKKTKDSTMQGIWGYMRRDPAEGPSDLLRGFSLVLYPIYCKNDSFFTGSFITPGWYDSSLTWEENGKLDTYFDSTWDYKKGPKITLFDDWYYYDSVTLINFTPESEHFNSYLIIEEDNSLRYIKKLIFSDFQKNNNISKKNDDIITMCHLYPIPIKYNKNK
jgi:hypothetical protein